MIHCIRKLLNNIPFAACIPSSIIIINFSVHLSSVSPTYSILIKLLLISVLGNYGTLIASFFQSFTHSFICPYDAPSVCQALGTQRYGFFS